MVPSLPRPNLPILACLVLMASLPTGTSAASLPVRASSAIVVILPSGPSSPKLAPRHRRVGPSRFGILRAWRGTRMHLDPEGGDREKADRMARQSLTIGIISLASIMLGWIPVAGGILALASVPLAVLALVMGFKARKLGSEKTSGIIFGFVSLGLFVLAIIAAVVFIAAFLLLWGL